MNNFYKKLALGILFATFFTQAVEPIIPSKEILDAIAESCNIYPKKRDSLKDRIIQCQNKQLDVCDTINSFLQETLQKNEINTSSRIFTYGGIIAPAFVYPPAVPACLFILAITCISDKTLRQEDIKNIKDISNTICKTNEIY